MVVVLAAAVVLAGVAAGRLFVWPSQDAVRAVDAVVLFAGGRGERLALAERLLADGLSSNLVLPNGNAPEWPAGNRACREQRAYRVHCLAPDPDTTQGEARAIAQLAEREGWRRVLVVTSTYQLSRAGLLLDRCYDGEVLTTAARPKLSLPAWGRRVAHEALAWTRAVALRRSC